MTVMDGDPDLLITRNRIEIFELPQIAIKPRPGHPARMQKERPQERAIAFLPGSNDDRISGDRKYPRCTLYKFYRQYRQSGRNFRPCKSSVSLRPAREDYAVDIV